MVLLHCCYYSLYKESDAAFVGHYKTTIVNVTNLILRDVGIQFLGLKELYFTYCDNNLLAIQLARLKLYAYIIVYNYLKNNYSALEING